MAGGRPASANEPAPEAPEGPVQVEPRWFDLTAGWRTMLATPGLLLLQLLLACVLFAYGFEVVVHVLVPDERLVMSTAEGPFPMETTYTWTDVPGQHTRMTLRNRGTPSGFAGLSDGLAAGLAAGFGSSHEGSSHGICQGQ